MMRMMNEKHLGMIDAILGGDEMHRMENNRAVQVLQISGIVFVEKRN